MRRRGADSAPASGPTRSSPSCAAIGVAGIRTLARRVDRQARSARVRGRGGADEPRHAVRQRAVDRTRPQALHAPPRPPDATGRDHAAHADHGPRRRPGRNARGAARRAHRPRLEAVSLDAGLPGWIGEVDGVDAVVLPSRLQEFDCRNNRLAWLALEQDGFIDAVAKARARWGAERVGVFLGTAPPAGCRPSSPTGTASPTARCQRAFVTHRPRTPTRWRAFATTALELAGPELRRLEPHARRARRCSATPRACWPQA